MSSQSRSASTAQEADAVVQSLEDLRWVEVCRASRRKLDRQRYPIEPRAQFSDAGVGADIGTHTELRRAFDEEQYSVGVSQRRDAPDMLPGNAKWFPARRDDSHVRTRRNDVFDGGGAGVDEVFTIVEDDQAAAWPQVANELLLQERAE